MAMGKEMNKTIFTELILQGIEDFQELQILVFLLLLVIYILTMTGNVLIIGLVISIKKLHTPMYIFLANLSFLETFYSSNILPKILISLLTGDLSISVPGCIAQFYFFASLVVTECSLLAIMSYDRYIAICKPLHYATLMNDRLCFVMAAGSWINGFLSMIAMVYLVTRLTFCGSNVVEHFFCDFGPVARISCSESRRFIMLGFINSLIFVLIPFLLTLTSYILIIISILRIQSTTGRQKAFSTCSAHLAVVTIYFGTLVLVYILPNNDRMRKLNKVFSAFYTILTPLVNPLIYSLRNREVKEAIMKSFGKLIHKDRASENQGTIHSLG